VRDQAVKGHQKRESNMTRLLKIAAAPATAAFALTFLTFTGSAPAQAGEYCRRDVTSAVVGCSFDTLEQCQAMSGGRGGDCFRDPFLPDRNALAYAPKAKAAAKHVKAH
jgi:hypothetical protein